MLTVEKIERHAESKMNALDRRLMAGALSQTEYDVCVKALDRDCEDMYRTLRAPTAHARY